MKSGGKKDLRTYETIVVIDSLLKSEEIDGIIEKVERILKNNGGNIVSIERWGKKRLAYEIKKRQYGYYVQIVFEAPNSLLRVLEKEYQLEENILRYLTVHLDKRALEYYQQQKLKETEAATATKVSDINEEKEQVDDQIVDEEDVEKPAVVEQPALVEQEENIAVIEPSSEKESENQ